MHLALGLGLLLLRLAQPALHLGLAELEEEHERGGAHLGLEGLEVLQRAREAVDQERARLARHRVPQQRDGRLRFYNLPLVDDGLDLGAERRAGGDLLRERVRKRVERVRMAAVKK